VFARLHTLETDAEQHDDGLAIIRDQLLPWLRDSTGFRGLMRLADLEGGKTLVITLWADRESLEASEEAGERLADLTARTVGVTGRTLENFEVTLFDVNGRSGPGH
jgi:heme-degrading monooxygenase HmoA